MAIVEGIRDVAEEIEGKNVGIFRIDGEMAGAVEEKCGFVDELGVSDEALDLKNEGFAGSFEGSGRLLKKRVVSLRRILAPTKEFFPSLWN